LAEIKEELRKKICERVNRVKDELRWLGMEIPLEIPGGKEARIAIWDLGDWINNILWRKLKIECESSESESPSPEEAEYEEVRKRARRAVAERLLI